MKLFDGGGLGRRKGTRGEYDPVQWLVLASKDDVTTHSDLQTPKIPLPPANAASHLTDLLSL
jgi:hypothetical protein